MLRGSSTMAGAIFVACALRATLAHADDTKLEAARQAYDRGARAFDAADYTAAASELALADELAANDVALELAIKAAVKADDPRTAITLATRAEKRTRTGALGAAAQAARTKMAGRTGTIAITCASRPACSPKIDGKDVAPAEPQVVIVGGHRVLVESAGAAREEYDVRVDPDAAVVVNAFPPSQAPIGPARSAARNAPSAAKDTGGEGARSGISPVWFWTGLGLTTVVSGAAVLSAVDTRNKHEDFRSAPTADLQQAGLDAQLRTNLLAGGAAVSALATLIVGLVFVDWRSPTSKPQPAMVAF